MKENHRERCVSIKNIYNVYTKNKIKIVELKFNYKFRVGT